MSQNFNFQAPAMSVGPAKRKLTQAVPVRWQDHTVVVGGDAPVVVQSMTNTDTADAIATAIQIKSLAQAGSELVRITVNTRSEERRVGKEGRCRGARGEVKKWGREAWV